MKVTLIALLLFFALNSEAKIVLNTYNTCSFEGPVTMESVQDVKLCLVDKVTRRHGKDYPIYLYMNSGGGSIYDGLNFIAFAKTIKNLHTITQFSASMAAAITQLLPGKRYVVENGIFMFHRAKGAFKGQFEDGELEQQLKLWKEIVRDMEQKQADRIGITLADYKKKRLNEWWLYGKSAVIEKVADQVETVSCTQGLIHKKVKIVVNGFFGSDTIVKSLCPLVN